MRNAYLSALMLLAVLAGCKAEDWDLSGGGSSKSSLAEEAEEMPKKKQKVASITDQIDEYENVKVEKKEVEPEEVILVGVDISISSRAFRKGVNSEVEALWKKADRDTKICVFPVWDDSMSSRFEHQCKHISKVSFVNPLEGQEPTTRSKRVMNAYKKAYDRLEDEREEAEKKLEVERQVAERAALERLQTALKAWPETNNTDLLGFFLKSQQERVRDVPTSIELYSDMVHDDNGLGRDVKDLSGTQLKVRELLGQQTAEKETERKKRNADWETKFDSWGITAHNWDIFRTGVYGPTMVSYTQKDETKRREVVATPKPAPAPKAAPATAKPERHDPPVARSVAKPAQKAKPTPAPKKRTPPRATATNTERW